MIRHPSHIPTHRNSSAHIEGKKERRVRTHFSHLYIFSLLIFPLRAPLISSLHAYNFLAGEECAYVCVRREYMYTYMRIYIYIYIYIYVYIYIYFYIFVYVLFIYKYIFIYIVWVGVRERSKRNVRAREKCEKKNSTFSKVCIPLAAVPTPPLPPTSTPLASLLPCASIGVL